MQTSKKNITQKKTNDIDTTDILLLRLQALKEDSKAINKLNKLYFIIELEILMLKI